MTPDDVVRSVMLDWLRKGFHGCKFAAKFASEPSGRVRAIILGTGSNLADQLQLALLNAATQKEALVVVFPDLRLDDDVARLIDTLSAHAAWSCSEVRWKTHPRGEALIRLEWQTPAKTRSVALGLAPLGTMPLTRRAPFVAIAVWPGGQENQFFKHSGDHVSLADMPHSLDAETHETFWQSSKQRKSELTEALAEGAARHDVSFCLRREAASLIRSLSATKET